MLISGGGGVGEGLIINLSPETIRDLATTVVQQSKSHPTFWYHFLIYVVKQALLDSQYLEGNWIRLRNYWIMSIVHLPLVQLHWMKLLFNVALSVHEPQEVIDQYLIQSHHDMRKSSA